MKRTKDEIDVFVDEWTGTPYRAGMCMPGRHGGVDCVRYLNAFLGWWHGIRRADIPREAQDAAFHDARVVAKVIRVFVEHYRPITLDKGGPFLPGDSLAICRTANPFHVGFVGSDGLTFHHAAPLGVQSSSIQAFSCDGNKIRGAYRTQA